MSQLRTITKTQAETTLAEQFAALPSPGADRVGAFAAFAKTGLPTRRDEAWHYTDLRAAMTSASPLASTPATARIEAAHTELIARERIADVRLVLLDGHYNEELSDTAPAGLLVAPRGAGAVAGRSDPLIALNRAFAPVGPRLAVVEGTKLGPRVEILHLAGAEAPRAIYTRVEISLAAHTSANFIETFSGAAPRVQRNALTLVELGASARCTLTTLVDDSADLHLESQVVELGADAEFSGFALVTGGGVARRQIFARHREPGARINLGGLALLAGSRHADTTLVVEHAAPRGRSREYYKHIVADEATGVYQGKVIVAQHAQKTDGGMKSQAILLSPTAVMNNKPELEIFADDVVCGHGATVGALDPEQLFYLQARGLARAEAEAMLLEAFGADAIDRVADEAVAEFLRTRMRAWLASRSRGEAGS